MTFYRLSRNTFTRPIGDFGYIYNQLTKHDRTYTEAGLNFVLALTREPQSFEQILQKNMEFLEGANQDEVAADLQEFLESLAADRYIVKGESAEQCTNNDFYFNYAENPKTLFSYNAQENPDDDIVYKDTQEVLGPEYQEHPSIHSAQIEVTNRCNERCIHCYIPHELKNNLMPYELLESVLQQLHDAGTISVTLSGGEFFCHPDAVKILRKARELDFSITILSNITLLTPELIEVLKEVNPSFVQTSLYSVDPEEHDHITQLKGSCEKTMGNIDALIRANIPVQISCPVMHTNFRTYKEVLKFAYERNCKAQTDYVMMARFDFTTDNLKERLTLEETRELLKDIIKFDKDYLSHVHENEPVKPSKEEWNNRNMCGVATSSMCIAANGVVYPCSGWQSMECGNVREQPIKDIWERSPQLQKLRGLKRGMIPQCYECKDYAYCAPCLVRNANENNGDYLKVSKHFCNAAHLNREMVEEALANLK